MPLYPAAVDVCSTNILPYVIIFPKKKNLAVRATRAATRKYLLFVPKNSSARES
jgi:hypothetical protein